MYGPGTAAQPPRPTGGAVVIGLRVLFTALPVVSFGLLAWVSMLRLALVRKRPLDWVMVMVTGAVAGGCFAFFAISQEGDTWQANVGAMLLMLCMLCTAVYFLVMDIRQGGTPLVVRPGPSGYGPAYGYPPMAGPGVAPGPAAGEPTGARWQERPYGYGQPNPAKPAPAAVRGPGTPIPAPAPAPTPLQTPAQAPAVPRAAPQPPPRINQVRAELDELSDYLRKEEGR